MIASMRCAILLVSLLALVACAAPKESDDYSNRILGRWLGSRKFSVFHADGSWGVQRNEDSPEEINGRRWRIQGNKLLLTFKGDTGLETAEFTIISMTAQRFVIEADDYKESYDRAP